MGELLPTDILFQEQGAWLAIISDFEPLPFTAPKHRGYVNTYA